LTSIARRSELLLAAGADAVVVLPVTHDLLRMSASDFFHEVVVRQLSANGVVEGPNFHFGRDRQGDVVLLQSLCEEQNIDCQIISAVETTGQLISSSRIRRLLGEGHVLDACALSGHAHRISGVVSRGAGRGRSIGFPTANIDEIAVMLPSHGVYAGTANVDGTRYVAAMSLGPNPTFEDNRLKVECFLDSYQGDLYGQELSVDLLSEIRPLQSFDTVDELKNQIQSDVAKCRTVVHRLRRPIFKICRRSEWSEANDAGSYTGSDVDLADGFIHFSTAEQAHETARRHFANQTDLVLVSANPLSLGSALKWEPSRGGDLFPHLYGDLPVTACMRIDDLPWGGQEHQFPFDTFANSAG